MRDRCLATHDFHRPIHVSGYDPNGPINCNLRTVSASLAYDDAASFESNILVVHQSILIPDLAHNLLSTMQLRLNAMTVIDVPRFLTENPTPLTHSLSIISTDDLDKPYAIPLILHRVASSGFFSDTLTDRGGIQVTTT